MFSDIMKHNNDNNDLQKYGMKNNCNMIGQEECNMHHIALYNLPKIVEAKLVEHIKKTFVK